MEGEFNVTGNAIIHTLAGAVAMLTGMGIDTDNIRSLEDANLYIVEEAAQLAKTGIKTQIPSIRAPKAWSGEVFDLKDSRECAAFRV